MEVKFNLLFSVEVEDRKYGAFEALGDIDVSSDEDNLLFFELVEANDTEYDLVEIPDEDYEYLTPIFEESADKYFDSLEGSYEEYDEDDEDDEDYQTSVNELKDLLSEKNSDEDLE
ncbi:MAG: DUF1292 domain-containing protein [Acholeplasmatales bacterium]|jgi:hypothetical protein|nr:DUF1292 domain-containing protein [Acholeplasmatales bacterium]